MGKTMTINVQTYFLTEVPELKGKYGAVLFLCQMLFRFRGKNKDKDIRLFPEEIGEDLGMTKSYVYKLTKFFIEQKVLVKGKRNTYALTESGKRLLEKYLARNYQEEREN